MFKKLSRMLSVVAAAILMLTPVGTAVQAEEVVTGDTFLAQIVGDYQPLFEGATLNTEFKTIQENMGHYSAAFTLDRYGHVTETMRQE